jgi:hypothetical protein
MTPPSHLLGGQATLLLPPALILFHDLKRREHPESLGEVLGRPSRWGELALIGVSCSWARRFWLSGVTT